MTKLIQSTYITYLSSFGKFTDVVTILIKKRNPKDGIYWRNEFATSTAKHFTNRLNKKIYKRAYKFQNKKLAQLVAYERGIKTDRPHFHIILERPTEISKNQFHSSINEVAIKMDWLYGDIDIRQYQNEDFIRYMCKGNFENILLEVCSKG